MTTKGFWGLIFSLALVCSSFTTDCYSQDTDTLKTTVPFDSLSIRDITAIGNVETGSVVISMTFHNGYHKLAGVSLSLTDYPDFGVTAKDGRKFKVFNNSHLIGTSNINKGYYSVPSVSFGDAKLEWITVLQQSMKYGDDKILRIVLPKFGKENESTKELHILATLSLDYANVGNGMYKVENLKVDWEKGK